jgi:hypothetical protein
MMQLAGYVLTGFALLFLVVYVITTGRPRVEDSLVHWHATVPGLRVSPERFYDVLCSALKRQGIPGAVVGREDIYEGHALTFKRPYIRVRRSPLVYYVFGAPLGDSFFISSWLLTPRSTFGRALMSMPLLGWMFRGIIKLIEVETFYTYDSALHFSETVHKTLLDVVDTLTSVENVKPLAADERKPVMRELYSRPKAPQMAL